MASPKDPSLPPDLQADGETPTVKDAAQSQTGSGGNSDQNKHDDDAATRKVNLEEKANPSKPQNTQGHNVNRTQ